MFKWLLDQQTLKIGEWSEISCGNSMYIASIETSDATFRI
jgi:hypothetical protein